MRSSRLISVGLTIGGLAVSGVALASPSTAAPATGVNGHAYLVKIVDTSNTKSYLSTDQQILDLVDASLSRWVVESGGGLASFTRVGAMATYSGSCADPTALRTAAWGAAGTLFPGVSFSGSSGNHLMVISPNGCGSGVGTVGSMANGFANGGKTFDDDSPSKGSQSLLHELGHNFGLAHAHALSCTSATTCTTSEYGDNYAIMGTTMVKTPAFVPASLDSFERDRLGVTRTCEVPAVSLAAGQHDVTSTWDLAPRGTDSGTQGAKITDPQTGNIYFIDWRNHTGRDANAYYGGATYNKGITVEQLKTDSNGNTSSLLQALPNPGSTTAFHYALNQGESFTSGGLRIQYDSTDPNTAQVTVILTNPSGTNSALPTQQGSAVVSGTPSPNATLSAAATNWTNGSCFRYQWYDNGAAIAGARSATYQLPAVISGHTYTVAITGQQAGYQPRTATSGISTPPATGITNGGFETGDLTGWSNGASGSRAALKYPHAGTYAGFIGSTATTTATSIIGQTFTAPNNVNQVTFTYATRCLGDRTKNGFVATIRDNTTGVTQTIAAVCPATTTWTGASASIIGGHNYTLKFGNFQAASATYSAIDDVALSATAPGPTNGGFESGDLAGWAAGSGYQSVLAHARTGAYAGYLGSNSNVTVTSAIAQTFTAPANATHVSFAYATRCVGDKTKNWFNATIRDNTTGTSSTVVATTCPGTTAWTTAGASVVAGHSYTLTFANLQTGAATYSAVDDLSLS